MTDLLIGPLPEPQGASDEAVEQAILDADPWVHVSKTRLVDDMLGGNDAN